jgi:OOP family OmpA-OmpF porin
MKERILVFMIWMSVTELANGQKVQRNLYRHPSVLEAHFLLRDFNEANITSRKMDPGIGIGYIGTVNHFLDWSVEFNGSYTSRISQHTTNTADKELLLETAGLIRGRLFSKESWIQPFLSTGIGALNYKSNFTGFIPAGLGIQFSYHNIFLLTNAQYRWPFSEKFNGHNYYSIGIGGLIAKKKIRKSVEVNRLPPFVASPGDRDGDGILDPEDACPEQPGMVKYKGCPPPDTDKDGVNDEEDNCITKAGSRENRGCPVVKKELTDEMKKAARNIFFSTNEFTILPESYSALATVIRILQSDPSLNLIIEGHTDNQGTPESNQVLSQNRANAVMNYLIKEGIDAARLKAEGFGQTRPVDDNGNSGGRANNRRVEMKLYF